MDGQSYWLDLFTGTTWQEFLDAGAQVSGFREARWGAVQRMKPGDYLLCYLTGLSRWIGVLEITSEPYKDSTQIWKDAVFPCRVHVKPVVSLTPETAVPILDMRDRLSIFRDPAHPKAWTGPLRGSPGKWRSSDGEAVVEAVKEAARNPVSRPVNPARLARRPRLFRTSRLVRVTVPDSEIVNQRQNATGVAPEDVQEPTREPSLHVETQWQLLKLGCDMGLDVWVARNDRGRTVNGHAFSELPRLKDELPLQFDDATNRTIELIDVLWLRGNAIVAAFEIECTTSIYSGLLRMSDLIAMQPNLNIPLYLVAPDERREKVISEVNRPTFSRLSPPMKMMCRFLSISVLRERLAQAAPFVRHLRADFLQELAESCSLDGV